MHRSEENGGDGLAVFYPSFEQVFPPPRRDAVRAWKGRIRPFPDLSNLGLILADLERGTTVDIDVGGALKHSATCVGEHAQPNYLPRLCAMDVTFEVLILEFAGMRHRQAYCVKPLISSGIFPTHPHLRRDHILSSDSPTDALCPYRSDETGPIGLLEYLDYVSIFLAKHLVWVRTLSLTCHMDSAAAITVYEPRTNPAHFIVPASGHRFLCAPWVRNPIRFEEFFGDLANRSHVDLWEGIWVGPSAPHDPATLVETVSRDNECTCGSGRRYGSCCRPLHLADLRGAGYSHPRV